MNYVKQRKVGESHQVQPRSSQNPQTIGARNEGFGDCARSGMRQGQSMVLPEPFDYRLTKLGEQVREGIQGVKVKCEACHGTGTIYTPNGPEDMFEDACEFCEGSGIIIIRNKVS